MEELTGLNLLHALAQYIHFNSVFGGGVANLAGEIAYRQDLFRNQAESIEMIADESVEIASKIFFAAIDEFGKRKTHRAMAKETLLALMSYYKCKTEQLSASEITRQAVKKVAVGYGLNRQASDRDLFHSIGFHMGSELLADEEFNIINKLLHVKQADLVAFLKAEGAYTWILVHTTVEADHFEAAVESGNCALQYYVGSAIEAKSWILEGFQQFAELQTEFINSLAISLASRCAA